MGRVLDQYQLIHTGEAVAEAILAAAISLASGGLGATRDTTPGYGICFLLEYTVDM